MESLLPVPHVVAFAAYSSPFCWLACLLLGVASTPANQDVEARNPGPPSQGYLRARLLPDTPVPLQSLSRVSSGDPEENSVSHRHTCGHRGHVSCSLRTLSEVVGRGRGLVVAL
jgi:hypothetical protein